MKFLKYEKIPQFRDVVRSISEFVRYVGRDDEGNPVFNENPLPKVEFIGTVKLHGTNASIVVSRDGDYYAQSRNRIVTPESDNEKFSIYASQKEVEFHFKNEAKREFDFDSKVQSVAYYGEWCGDNIQKGVALSKIPKRMFVLFACVKFDGEGNIVEYEPLFDYPSLEDHGIGVYTSMKYAEETVDIENYFQSVERLESLTAAVENECPFVKKYFDVSGVGEGIVWFGRVEHNGNVRHFMFKTKGEKHSNSKVKNFDASKFEGIKKTTEFADNFLTESRLQQGVAYLKEMQHPVTPKSTGIYIGWVVKDIITEEEQAIKDAGIDLKILGHVITKKAREWYLKNGIEVF